MKRFRHILYWSTVAVAFIPMYALTLARVMYDVAEELFDRYHSWAYREHYVRIPR